jgi:rhodanese-related sulfurtransferase
MAASFGASRRNEADTVPTVDGAQRRLRSSGTPGEREVVRTLGLAPATSPIRDDEPRSLERLVNEAAEQITRFSAPQAFAASTSDGLIVDIRSHDARDLYGVVPGSLHVPRTVLEWRIALDSPWRNPHLGGLDQRLILICDHGYSSILAARNLVQLGFHRAGDVIGGFEVWRDSGLPVAPCRRGLPTAGVLPGTGPPD